LARSSSRSSQRPTRRLGGEQRGEPDPLAPDAPPDVQRDAVDEIRDQRSAIHRRQHGRQTDELKDDEIHARAQLGEAAPQRRIGEERVLDGSPS
jgi:hypothetical protein